MRNFLLSLLFILFCAGILALSIRGIVGNPLSEELNSPVWREDGPFELSPERGRFALLYSVIEDHSLYFSESLGKFADPDVGINKGRYVSLFAPGLSFLVIPGYILGRYFDVSQVGAFAVVSLFALLNLILLRLISIRLGANPIAASIASVIFIFATPAFVYASTLYQHHVSTFLILISIYVLLKSNKIWSLLVVFFAFAISIPLDYPNLFLMFPIAFFALGRIVYFEKIKNNLSVRINLLKILTPFIMIIPIFFFLWFNQISYGNPLQLSGTLETSKHPQRSNDLETITKTRILKEEGSKRSATAFFKTRNLIDGFYIHLLSPDRGMIYYTPVMVFGIIGFVLALRRKAKLVSLLAAIVGANILLYSMWGDPAGGWAFGSRYLVPSYAILSIFIALLLTYWRKKIWFLVPFVLIAFYSIAVNTLGAITTSAMPPKTEILELEKVSGIVQKYTYERNWDVLVSGHSKSFAYQTFLKDYLSPLQFYQILIAAIFIFISVFVLLYAWGSYRKGKND